MDIRLYLYFGYYNAAMNMGVQIIFEIYPKVGLLNNKVVPFFFSETSIPFSTGATPIYILTNTVHKFPCLHILTKTYLSFLMIVLLSV